MFLQNRLSCTTEDYMKNVGLLNVYMMHINKSLSIKLSISYSYFRIDMLVQLYACSF